MPPTRILVATADPHLAAELVARVAGLGHGVAGVASSARDALAQTEAAVPSALVMDAAIGGTPDAFAVATEIRRRWVVPTLFVVDERDDASLARLATVEPPGFVLRPLAERDLRVRLDVALRAGGACRAASELEERFFDVSVDLLCCLGFDGYFRRLSPSWERALGWTRAELMSRPFLDWVHEDDRARTLAQNRAVRGGGQARLFENRYRCRDGSYRWLLWNATPDVGAGVIFSVARDVTERRAAEVERDGLLEELRTALAEVRTLRELLAICSYCRRIRDDEGRWDSVENYISRHTDTRFTHGICPSCYDREYSAAFGEPPAGD
ncbi:PAS domain S-box protein [Roseisolibacter sp. H3M3-2]|uniref:PAS domain S-box protein n=1 Tax=Roseisolibacter sp. H3M3-2 TaxID=3031323 RepID=UPI0023DC1E0C|nr:PAS domain S-box protein [Roseisolibacter sp. H3M3-2]MDF1503287.1 PAS domain S-box protein [Roseisolibacter sp. H3M3-2]